MKKNTSSGKPAQWSDIKDRLESTPLYGANAAYLESMYEAWIQDSEEIEPEWAELFAQIATGKSGGNGHAPSVQGNGNGNGNGNAVRATGLSREPIHSLIRKDYYRIGSSALNLTKSSSASHQLSAMKLIEAYRSFGHTDSRTNPLVEVGYFTNEPAVLNYTQYGIDAGDLDRYVDVSSTFAGAPERTIRQLIEDLRRTYCGTIGIEYQHTDSAVEREWWRQTFESYHGDFTANPPAREHILKKLIAAEELEQFLHSNYVGQKRFSIEGGESLIVILDQFVQSAPRHKISSLVFGMAHRGRLNVLINVMGKTPAQLIDEFEGRQESTAVNGDVKYHLGYSADIKVSGAPIHMALAFNPSHLEIVSPVVAGSCHGRRIYFKHQYDSNPDSILPIIVHGDAAFSGQGVVMETLNMSQTRGYAVGGMIHVIINNQIGFTTSDPCDARSTRYCSDPAKIINAPVLHVNGDDPEACALAATLAMNYRMKFHKDIVIDMICYRRQGHNEADEPIITQPMMYQRIRELPSCKTRFAQRCIKAGDLTPEQLSDQEKAYYQKIRSGEVAVDYIDPNPGIKHGLSWKNFMERDMKKEVDTGLSVEQIKYLGKKIFSVPDNVTLHQRIEKLMGDRLRMASGALTGDWGFAELIAHASLLEEGYVVRLSGQDCARGTFSHRHVRMFDQNNGEPWIPMMDLAKHERQYEVIDSLLSEEAVLAFEYGYSTFNPNALTIWEAQFGDFANGAQVVIDQFISSGEQKWARLSGLVMLLPHGYEGQGPEHSSARLERFLQLCAQGNMQVCNPTNSAQIFHLLRRQMLRSVRRPLVVMSPKSLLRHKDATSSLDEFVSGCFHRVLFTSTTEDEQNVKRVVICSGKIYYQLYAEALRQERDDIAFLRIEQLYPFPMREFCKALSYFTKCREFVWCQEEPKNQGAWYTTVHHLRRGLGKKMKYLGYAGRDYLSSPAVGLMSVHTKQQQAIIDQAINQKFEAEI